MIFYTALTLLASLAHAGGPAATPKSAKTIVSKRNTPATEYLAITSFPNDLVSTFPHYCLRNRGGIAGLETCTQPTLTDARFLFNIVPSPGHVKGEVIIS